MVKQSEDFRSTQIFGHVAVSASFDPSAVVDGQLRYLTEAKLLRAADPQELIRGMAFGVPEDLEVLKKLCVGFRDHGFGQLRGIVMGCDLTNPLDSTSQQESLLETFEHCAECDLNRSMLVAQNWPAGKTGQSFDEVLETFAENVSSVLRQAPWMLEVGIEPLIPAEQEHVNTLAKARRLARAVNRKLDRQIVYPVPDLAHLFGMLSRDHWPDVVDQLWDAIEAGEVPYGHISIPETRTDMILEAIESGEVPAGAIEAFKRIPWIDTEGFDPNDECLEELRKRVPRFGSADPSGWTESKRFERFANVPHFFAQ